MQKPIIKKIYLSILIGLSTVQPVPAIDGDYVNPYATSPQVDNPPVWDGVPVYGGKNKKLPFITLMGAGLLLMGIGTGAYYLIRDHRQRISS